MRREVRAGTPVSVTVGTTALQLVGRNPLRVMIAIVNTGGVAVTIGLGSAPSAANAGIVLNPSGGSLLLDGNNPFYDGIYAISSGAGTTVGIQETGWAV